MKEYILEDALREHLDKLRGGLTELDRAFESFRKDKGRKGGWQEQPRKPLPKKDVPGTFQLYESKGSRDSTCVTTGISTQRPYLTVFIQ